MRADKELKEGDQIPIQFVVRFAGISLFLTVFDDALLERNGANGQDFSKDITLTVRDLTESNDPSQLYQYTDGMKNRDS